MLKLSLKKLAEVIWAKNAGKGFPQRRTNTCKSADSMAYTAKLNSFRRVEGRL